MKCIRDASAIQSRTQIYVEDRKVVFLTPGLRAGTHLVPVEVDERAKGPSSWSVPPQMGLSLDQSISVFAAVSSGSHMWSECAAMWLQKAFAAHPDRIPWTLVSTIQQPTDSILKQQAFRIAATHDLPLHYISVVSFWVKYVFLSEISQTEGGEEPMVVDDVVLDYTEDALYAATRARCIICGACYDTCELLLKSVCCGFLAISDIEQQSTLVAKVNTIEKQISPVCMGSSVDWG